MGMLTLVTSSDSNSWSLGTSVPTLAPLQSVVMQGFFLGCMQLESTRKSFLATKGIKIQDFFWMKKPNVNHEL
jgi:hypothetical protein